MELDERKKIILKAIIQNYLETGEPVGSRTISKYTELNLSSATIRNEMADLEEMGYILQPHTSAGRIPSDKGYRMYVNELIEEKNQELDEAKEWMLKKTDRLENMLKQVVQVLAKNTKYATMIAGPSYHQNSIKFLQLSRVNEEQLLLTIVTEGNLVKTQIIQIESPVDDESLLELNLLLNTQMNGLTIGEINLDMIRQMKQQAGIHSDVISTVVDAVADVIRPDEEEMPLYTSGAKNFFRYPELADSTRASELISAFEEKTELATMLREVVPDEEEPAEGEPTPRSAIDY
ncbi:MAG: heat-inducible transcription repressor HrcA [Eubacterium sp.]|nr:heat-inducible transcription repressor HrcA [Eubacterium sp.]